MSDVQYSGLDNKAPVLDDIFPFEETTESTGAERQKHATGAQIKTMVGADVNEAYKDRIKTKVLWTGPLSVVSTPTSLDGSEKFSDWDRIEIHGTVVSDSDIGTVIPFTLSTTNSVRWLDSSGNSMIFDFIDDTSFQISSKSASLGNIQRIIGISL